MFKEIIKHLKIPEFYEPSTHRFWDDDHISKGMLKEHFNSESDLSTRKPEFVKKSVGWISSEYPPEKYNKLLDLGCGPGIYAELFHKKGYKVTGVDLSQRSIDYAIENANKNSLDITYKCENYLEMNLNEKFDIITLIWCDFGVLRPGHRNLLLCSIHEMLSPDGVLILDVWSEAYFKSLCEGHEYDYALDGGFWDENPYLLLKDNYLYDENAVIFSRNVVITEKEVKHYNFWEHCFNKTELTKNLENANFKNTKIYNDVAGEPYSEESKTLCAVAEKKEGYFEKIFMVMVEAIPKPDNIEESNLGAYVNCCVKAKNKSEAHKLAADYVDTNGWNILKIEDTQIVQRNYYEDEDSKESLKCFDEASNAENTWRASGSFYTFPIDNEE